MKTYPLGNILAIDVGPYWHVGIASYCDSNGVQYVIENSKQTALVQEVPVRQFSGDRPIQDRGSPGRMHARDVIGRARLKVGVAYNLFSWNCEHLVSWAHGESPRSPQIERAALGAGLLALVALFVAAIKDDGEYDPTVGRKRGSDGRFRAT